MLHRRGRGWSLVRERRWGGRGGAVRRPPGRRCRAGAVRTAPAIARLAGTAHGTWRDPGVYVSSRATAAVALAARRTCAAERCVGFAWPPATVGTRGRRTVARTGSNRGTGRRAPDPAADAPPTTGTRSSVARPNLPHGCVDARAPTDAPPRRASAPGPARGHARGAPRGGRLTARGPGRTLSLSSNDKGD